MTQPIFVGREKELNILNQLLEQTKEGLGKLVLVRGEPGAGKSSLIRKFLSFHDSTFTAIAECVDKEGTTPYSPIKTVLAELIAADTSNSKEEKGVILNNLKKVLSEAGPDWIAAIPVIGSFAVAGVRTFKAARDLSEKQLKASEISGEKEIQKLFEDELRRLAEKKPVIVFLDDLQWTDPSTLNMLFVLGRSLREKPFPLFLIGSYRHHEFEAGKEDPRLKNKAHTFFNTLTDLRSYKRPESHIERDDEWFVEVDLPALGETDIDVLINSEFPGNQFPPDFATRLESITEGNPLFVTGVLRFLKQGGEIFPDENGIFQLKANVLDSIPETVEAVIERRLDFLSKELRIILDYASVNGNNFSFQVIERLLEMKDKVLIRNLGELSNIYDLINEYRTEELDDIFLEFYCFKHTLVYKYIYESMHAGERRLLHRKVAEVIKNLFGDKLVELKELKDLYNKHLQIGRGLIDGTTLQLTKGMVTSKIEIQTLLDAASAEVESAEQGFEQYAINECIEKAEKALAFLEKLPEITLEAEEIKFKALFWKSKAQGWLGHYKEAEQTALQLLQVAKNQNQNKNIASALNRVGRENESLGENDKAIDYYRKAIEVAESLDSNEDIADMYNNLGWVLSSKCDHEIAIGYHRKALTISEGREDKKNIALSYICIGSAFDGKGEYDKAVEYYRKCQIIREELNDRNGVAMCYNNIGNALTSKGDYDKAIEHHKKSLEIREQVNNRVGVAMSYDNIGNALNSKGDYDEAIRYHKKSLAISESLNDRVSIAFRYNNIGNALNSKGDYDEAIRYHKKSLAISESLNDRMSIAFSYNNIGNALYSKGEYDETIRYYQKSLAISESLNDRVSIARCYNNIGNILNTKGDYDEAIKSLQKSLEISESLNDRVIISMCYNNIGSILDSKGDYAQAVQYYLKSVEISENLGDQVSLARSYNNIGNTLKSKGEYNEAVEYYKKSLEMYESLDKLPKIAQIYNNIGNALKSTGDYVQAIGNYKKALEIWQSTGDIEDMAASYDYIARAFDSKGDYGQAIEYHKRSLQCEESLDNKSGMAISYNEIGSNLDSQGNYDQAVLYYLKSLKIKESLDDKEGIARCYSNIGNSLDSQGEYDQAIQYYEKSLELNKSLGNSASTADDYNSIGLALYSNKQYDEAIVYLDQALTIRKDLKDNISMARTYLGEGMVYHAQQDYKTAVRCLEESLSLCEGSWAQGLVDVVVNSMVESMDSIIYQLISEEDYAAAIQYCNRLLSHYQRLEMREEAAIRFIKTAQLHEWEDDNSAAIRCYEEAIQLSDGCGSENKNDDRFNQIGDILAFNSYYQSAMEYYEKALAIYENMGDSTRMAKVKDKILAVKELDNTE